MHWRTLPSFVKGSLIGLAVGIALSASLVACSYLTNDEGLQCLVFALLLSGGYVISFVFRIEPLLRSLPRTWGDADALTWLLLGPVFYMLLGGLLGWAIAWIRRTAPVQSTYRH